MKLGKPLKYGLLAIIVVFAGLFLWLNFYLGSSIKAVVENVGPKAIGAPLNGSYGSVPGTDSPGAAKYLEAAKAAGMNLKVARELVQKLQDDGHIRPGLVDSERSDGRPIKVWRYWPTSEGSDEPDDGAF